MSKSQIQNQVNPEVIKGKINLPNQRIDVGSNAVDNSGKQTSIVEMVKNLKRAAREQLFPPIANPQNG